MMIIPTVIGISTTHLNLRLFYLEIANIRFTWDSSVMFTEKSPNFRFQLAHQNQENWISLWTPHFQPYSSVSLITLNLQCNSPLSSQQLTTTNFG
nr:hypothetical transcript [Hymenolepis microstoma]